MSANTYIAKLEFSSPLAKGEADLRPDRPPLMGSDTMFSALCHTWAELYGEQSLEEQLQAFGEAPPFLLSSMYVYSPHTYYLPKPLLPPACALPTECAARLRRVHWLPLDYFRADEPGFTGSVAGGSSTTASCPRACKRCRRA